MHKKQSRIFGSGLIILGILILLLILYKNSPISDTPVVFSERNLLQSTWGKYKENYIEPTSGRTLDIDQDNITTSEGQGYTMLRAVWQDDKETFDKSYKFAKDILKRPADNLFAWRYGQTSSGKFGILTAEGGQNSASDGDTDIALALVFAANRFGDSSYLSDAKKIIQDIWTYEVVNVKGKYYMGADNFEAHAVGQAVLNPSYSAPYAYRIFAKIDTAHDWEQLANDSYAFLSEVSEAPLDKDESVGLPPEWVVINKSTGVITASKDKNFTTDYGFNAFRTPWRIALDKQWFNTPLADDLLAKFQFLSSEWRKDKVIHPTYSHDGKVVIDREAAAIYGGNIGYFMYADEANGKEVYQNKLQILYNPDTASWKDKLSYYDDNWVWFGIGLYNNLLPNFAENNITNQ